MGKQKSEAQRRRGNTLLRVLKFPFTVLWYAVKAILALLGAIITAPFQHGKDVSEMTGYEYEDYVAERLKRMGYKDIDVTPRSGDFGADILARDRGKLFVCFQCKNYGKPVGPKAVQEIYAAIQHYGCDYGVVVSASGYTESAHTLAEDCGVELWDGI